MITTIILQLSSTQSTWPCIVLHNHGNNTQNAEIQFVGDLGSFCHFQIATVTSVTVLEVPSTRTPFFLYVEREDAKECSNIYVMIDGQAESCHAVFAHGRFKLILRGHINVTLKEIYAVDQPIPMLSGCSEFDPDFTDNITVSANTKCKLESYGQIISCDTQNGEDMTFCRLSFPNKCNASLGYRKVELKCDENDEEFQKVLLVYPDITHLELSGNNIVNINSSSFYALSNLKVISLERNQLQQLPGGIFDDLDDVIELDISENQLKSLGKDLFSNLQQLNKLFLNNNHLTVLPLDVFHRLHNLMILYLHENQIKTLESGLFHGLTKLSVLTLHANMLSTIPNYTFDDLSNLRQLWLYRNQLKTIPSGLFQNLTMLTLLHLGNNMLTSLPNDAFQDLYSLQELYLFNNQLATIPNALGYGVSLTYLQLSGNMLSTLPKDTFLGLDNLQKLYLYKNGLNTIQTGLFHSLTTLWLLHLGDNMLTSFSHYNFQQLYNLQILYLYENQITKIPSDLFLNLTQMIFLNLDYNSVMTIEFGSFTDMTKLVNLGLAFNNLSHLYTGIFRGLGNLEILTLSYNKVTGIDPGAFHPLLRLKTLDLSSNMLTELSTELFWGLDNVEVLSLSRNWFVTLNRELLIWLTKLNVLYLYGNQLNKLDSDIFNETLNLYYLDLSFNRFQRIPNIKHLVKLNYLNLAGNPFLKIKKSTFSALHKDTKLIASQHEICECFVPVDVTPTCSASDPRSPYLTCDRLLEDRTLVAMMWLIALNAIGGNIFVLVWKKRHARKNKVQDLLLSNLAISDSIMGIYMLIIACADIYFGIDFPMQSEKWRSGIMCRIAGSLSILSSEASVFFVTLISIDRFICVRFPFTTKRLSRQSSCVAIALIWLFSLILGVIPSSMAGENVRFYDNSHVCIGLPLSLIDQYLTGNIVEEVGDEYTIRFMQTINTTYDGALSGMHFSNAVFLGLNGICYLVILCCYIIIVRTTFQSSKRSGLNKKMKEELKMTLKVTAVVATDFCCWFPVILLGILVQARVLKLPASVYAWCVTFVLPINSAINPYLYTIAYVVSDWRKQRAECRKQLEMVKQQRNTVKSTGTTDTSL